VVEGMKKAKEEGALMITEEVVGENQ